MIFTQVYETTNNLDNSFNISGLRVPQINHAKTLLASILRRNYAMDLSEMGTGKTYSACSIARYLNVPTFVVCPKIVRRTWERVLMSFGITNFTVVNYDKLIRGNTPHAIKEQFAQDPRYKKNKYDVPYVMLLRFKIPSNSLIIFDESHKCKAENSSTSELLFAAWQQGYKFLMLSATQAASPKDMFILGRILNQHKFFDYNEWMKEFVEKDSGYWRVSVDMDTATAKARMKELHDDIYNRGMASRLTPKDFPNEFKNNKVVPECFDMGDGGNTINQIYSDMFAEIKRLEERGYKDCILAEIVKARRMAELQKVSTFVDLASDAHEQGKSVCIFVNYVDTLDSIVSRLSKKFGRGIISIIRGGQKEDERDVEVARFQADQSRFIVCNIAAGGVGVGLHDLNGNFPRVSFISPNWSCVLFKQCLGRIYRNGGLTDCIQYIVFCADSIEEKICVNLRGKMDCMDLLNDGDFSLTGYGLNGIVYVESEELETADA
jgi:superfamily II DNA or RNA helicase